MAGGQRALAGGIYALRVEVLNQPKRRAALQYDLLKRGLTLENLGTEGLTWYDLGVFVQMVQYEHDSALARELHGQVWSIEGQIMANVYDVLALANWQRAGKKHAPKPKRLPRPWEKAKATVLGSSPIPISKFNDWWDSKAAERKAKKRRWRAKKPPTE